MRDLQIFPVRGVILVSFLTLTVLLLSACGKQHVDPVVVPRDAISLRRGSQLVNGLAACGVCHGAKPNPSAPLSGGRVFEDRYGEVIASNITPHSTGIADWSPDELITALRGSVGKDGRGLSTEAHTGFEWLADFDLLAIIGYLRTLTPVENEIEPREVSFIERNTVGIMEVRRNVRGFIPVVDPRNKTEFGRYLVNHVARCGTCHNSPAGLMSNSGYLDGGKSIEFNGDYLVAPNITGSKQFGIGTWSIAQIASFLSTGMRPDGAKIDTNFCPIEFYSQANQLEKEAIGSYLLTTDF